MNALMTLSSTLWSLLQHEGLNLCSSRTYLKERQGIRIRAMFVDVRGIRFTVSNDVEALSQ